MCPWYGMVWWYWYGPWRTELNWVNFDMIEERKYYNEYKYSTKHQAYHELN